jgi:hypothetical protein
MFDALTDLHHRETSWQVLPVQKSWENPLSEPVARAAARMVRSRLQ